MESDRRMDDDNVDDDVDDDFWMVCRRFFSFVLTFLVIECF